jgi:hypothetical protein
MFAKRLIRGASETRLNVRAAPETSLSIEIGRHQIKRHRVECGEQLPVIVIGDHQRNLKPALLPLAEASGRGVEVGKTFDRICRDNCELHFRSPIFSTIIGQRLTLLQRELAPALFRSVATRRRTRRESIRALFPSLLFAALPSELDPEFHRLAMPPSSRAQVEHSRSTRLRGVSLHNSTPSETEIKRAWFF